jgi:LysR family glycine cleavage system transcriptional activator
VVLSYPALASADLAQGRLIAPFDLEMKVDFAYYALTHEAADLQPRVAAFRDWLLGEAGAKAAVH